MKLFSADQFLTKRSAQLPQGEWRGVAIHPASEVDLVDIGGHRLGVGGVMPIAPGGGQSLAAVRFALAESGLYSGAQDGLNYPGERLVLALYEACDPLVPMGPRVPAVRYQTTTGIAIPPAVGAAVAFFRLPFQGRAAAAITMYREDITKDMTVVVVGVRAYAVGKYINVQATPETWWNGGASGPTDIYGGACGRTVYVGGQGDSAEVFDELLVCVYGDQNVLDPTELVAVHGESYGERQ